MKLGQIARDKITGFKGVLTGHANYLTGCDQYLLSPKCKEDGSHIDGRWFDEGRLEVFGDAFFYEDVKANENRCDIQAPVK